MSYPCYYGRMIGIFDSGFGGLTTMNAISRLLPQYDYTYLGDNARTPYGIRSHDIVKKYTEEAMHFLWDKGCGLIIIACNTASAQALPYIQQKYHEKLLKEGKKVLGVTIPIAEEAVSVTRSGRIGVVATTATIESQSFSKELHKLNQKIVVLTQSCPLIVPFVEEGWHLKPEARTILKKYLRPLKSQHVDTLILGCTHYSFMMKDFVRIMGKNCRVLDDSTIVAKSLKNYLSRHPEIEKDLSKKKNRTFYTTGDCEKFASLGQGFLGLEVKNVKKAQLQEIKT